MTGLDEAWEVQAIRDHNILLAKMKLEEDRLTLEEKRLVLNKEQAKQCKKLEEEHLALDRLRMDKIIDLITRLPRT